MSQKKRAHVSESPSPSPAHTDNHSGPKRPKEAFNTPRPLRALKIHIIKAKLEPSTIAELVNQAENEGAIVCADPRDAEVLVTNVGMRKRLERHVPWAVAVSRSSYISRILYELIGIVATESCRETRLAPRLHQRRTRTPLRQIRSARRPR